MASASLPVLPAAPLTLDVENALTPCADGDDDNDDDNDDTLLKAMYTAALATVEPS